MLRRLFSLIFSRYLFITLGLIALGLAIWYLGPLFAFANYRPLEPVKVRVWIIIGILVLLLLRLLLKVWKKQRMNARLIDAVMGMREAKPAGPEDPSRAAIDELRSNFERALGQLKKTRFGGKKDGGGLMAQFSQKYLYQIPWYVFIGAPGSGKTTALLNSGLRFPLAEEMGKESIRGVGGTRSCDWWFADETVLLDTAGRYTMQESDAAADKAEWEGFLKLLKKFRPRQPLNGAILTVSVADLLGSNEDERSRHAARIRARLNELTDNLNIAFPIYVLVSKVDLLGGFNEYFNNLSKEERAQVWGFTLPLQLGGEVNREQLGKQMEIETDLLARRLFDKLPELMLQESDTARRARAYTLPQHFANLTPLVRQLLQNVFADSKFAPQAMLRGVYFTSGTQEGTPFDRLLGSLNRSLGFDGRVSLQQTPKSGKSYFLQDLLHKVIFPEAHLAGRNRRAERRERWLSIAGHTGVLALLALAVTGWAVSYKRNNTYIDFVDSKTALVDGHLKTMQKGEGATLLELLPGLNALYKLADGPTFTVDDPPINLTYGLYQGGKLDAATQDSYRKAIERALMPLIVRRLEEVLRTTPEDNLELTYETLKVYLMLAEPKHYDASTVEAFLRLDLDRSLPTSATQEQRDQLFIHLSRLLKADAVTSPFPVDVELVKQKREQLARYSLAQRAYSRLKNRLNNGSLSDFTVAEAGGPQATLVFRRASGQPMTKGIPGLYTFHGYHNVFLPEAESILGLLENEEGWVLDRVAQRPQQQLEALSEGALQRDLKRLYLHEYVGLWEAYLSDVRLVDSSSMSQSIETARILAAPDSPLAQFLRAVARETTLIKPDNANDNSVVGQVKRQVTTAKEDLARTLGPSMVPAQARKEERLERIVDDRFEPIRRLVRTDTGAPQIDQVMKLFNEVYMNMSGTQAALATRTTLSVPSTEVLTRVRAEAAQLPMPLRGMLENLAESSSRQTDGSIRSTLGGELDSSLGEFCRRAIQGRYPFQRAAQQDVTLADFGRMFAQGGMMDQFFQSRLAPMADVSGSTWILRQPGGATVGLGSFQKAARIRDVFFPSGGKAMDLSFEFKVLEMDATIEQMTLDVDGQVFRYAHGPQVPNRATWPGPRATNTVRIVTTSARDGEKYMVKTGPWALFRLFDEGEIRAGGGPERFVAALLIHGKRIVIEVTASSVQNPFRLPELVSFSCPGRI